MGFNELKFRKTLEMVPEFRELFEQVKGRSWSVDRLYKYAPSIFSNPSTWAWKLVDGNEAVRGVLWIVIDVLSEKINVIVFSVDKEYEDGSIEGARKFLDSFRKSFNAMEDDIELKEKINWVTSEPEVIENMGGKQPKTILMEI